MIPVMASWRLFVLTVVTVLGTVTGWTGAAAQDLPRDPKQLTFEASPDHDRTDAAGPIVRKYLVEFATHENGPAVKMIDLGKPDAPGGVITVPLAGAALPDGRYFARVRAVGATTSTVSAAVGPFLIGEGPPKPGKKKPAANTPTAAATPAAKPASTGTASAPAGSHANGHGTTGPAAKTSADPAKPGADPGTTDNAAKDKTAPKPPTAKPAQKPPEKKGFWRRMHDAIFG